MLAQKNKKGFSLIEVMVATFLVTVGLVVIISLLSIGIKNTAENKKNLIAGFLSQEGTELVRNKRDTNWKNGIESFFGISSGNCRIDVVNNNLQCGSSNFKLYFKDDEAYKYGGNSDEKTVFSRKIIIEDGAGGEQKIITSLVIWGEDFPSGSVDTDNCNTANQCAFSKISLTKWKEE